MKAASFKILLLVLLTSFLLPLNAQNLNYSSPGGLKMGLGLGSSYQTSDLKNFSGSGFDIWLGTSIYQKENAVFALDWRFRFLAGINRAYDHRVNMDGSYSNVQLRHFNYDLELVLSLNRLRERTRIILSGFVGAGVMHGITATDLLDASNTAYDYSTILPGRDPSEIREDLDQLTDKEFETDLQKKVAILPTAGLYLGYQISPRFALGVEHKMNFSLSEDNSTFGLDMDNRVSPGSTIDWNNYTSLVFRWSLRGRSSGKARTSSTSTTTSTSLSPSSDPTAAIVAYRPQLDIIIPYTNPYDATESQVKVTARILNITRKGDISVRLNGQNQDFMFYSSNNRVEINTNLQLGSNSLEISCENEAGRDSDHLMLNYRIPSVENPSVKNPPALRFINPPSGLEVEQDRYTVKIQSTNIAGKEDVTLSVNGRRVYDFNYDRNGIISLDLDLDDGRNEVVVSGRNADGTAEDRTNISYVKRELGLLPEVKIIQPPASRSGTFDPTADIMAEISHIESRTDINFRVNGVSTNDFYFDPATKRLMATVRLQSSTTRVLIDAQNSFGSDSDSRDIIKQILACPNPVISFYVTESGTPMLRGNVLNVRDEGGIRLFVNGRPYNNWRFSSSTGEIQSSLHLEPGSHTIEISATNECGSDRESQIIVIEAPCLPPQVGMNITEVAAGNASHLISARIQNISLRENITLILDGTRLTNFQFNSATGQLTANLNLDPGSYDIVIHGMNECGSKSDSKTLVVVEPCTRPSLSFNVSEVSTASASHQIRGEIQNVKTRSQVTFYIDERPENGFQYNPTSGEIQASLRLEPGTHNIEIDVRNDCGSAADSKTVVVEAPCIRPSLSFSISEVSTASASHQLRGEIQNVKTKSQVTLYIDERPSTGFQYNPTSGEILASLHLEPGTHNIEMDVRNECGSTADSKTVVVDAPCLLPSASMNIAEVSTGNMSHQLKAILQNVERNDGVTLMVNDVPQSNFNYNATTGQLTADLNLDPGTHRIDLSVENACGRATESASVTVEIEIGPGEGEQSDPNIGWVRINPGNSAWEFCLQTPGGTYSREDLSTAGFSYSGTASSLYIKPIAGGGTAKVNGKAFTLNPGQYYLFTGSLKVQVTNKRQGAMGHWSVYIESSTDPSTGKGNKRPKSPCETVSNKVSR